jgi:hypothetical protein
MIDLNSGSGFVYGGEAPGVAISARINALIDAALIEVHRRQPPRYYLGGSRVGEPCPRKLVYEVANLPVDPGKEFDGRTLRIFAAGHQFETLSIDWLRAAGFDLWTACKDGGQFGFATAGGRIRGHIDGVIVDGPDVGIAWPALFEHKALNAKSWSELVKRGVKLAKPIYYAQLQIYMAYMELERALFTALNKDTQALHHELVAFDAVAAQILSDQAVEIVRAADAGELPPRIAASDDFYLCRWCSYAERCWSDAAA